MKLPSNKKLQIVVVVVLVILNVFGYRLVRGYVDLIAYSRLQLAIEDISEKISSRVDGYTHVLQGAAGLFSASEKVIKDEWGKYVEELEIEQDFSGIQVLGYAPYLTSENLSAFQDRLPSLGIVDYKIYPELTAGYSAPVMFLYPSNELLDKVVGFNMVTDPIRKEAIDTSIVSGKLGVSDKLVPLIDKARSLDGVGVAMFYPVYWNGTDISTEEGRKKNIKGFIVAGIRPVELMSGLTLKAAPSVNFQVFDNSSEGELNEKSLIYNSGGDELLKPGFVSRYSNVGSIVFPNTTWHVRFVAVPDNQLFDLFRYTPYFVLVLNILLSIVFFLFIRKILILYRSADKRSLDYAQKLLYEDAIIDSDDEGIIMTDQYGLITVFNSKAEQVLGYKESEIQNKMDFLNLIPKTEISLKVAELQKRTGIAIKHDFDAIITDCLLDGRESCQWSLINKDGLPRRTDMVVRPVYDKNNQLLGYKFTF